MFEWEGWKVERLKGGKVGKLKVIRFFLWIVKKL